MLSWFVFLLNLNLFAQPQWQDLVLAQSADEFVAIDRQLTQIQVTKSGCEQELQSQVFPKYCFERLKSLLETPGGGADWLNLLQKSSQICVNTVHQLNDQGYIRQLLKSKIPSSQCLGRLEEQLKDLVYIYGRQPGPEIEYCCNHEESASTKSLL